MEAVMVGVAVEGVGKSFGSTRVLQTVSLTVEPGEFVSLVGPSGCGKTTLMRIIAGLELPSAGRISIAGRDVTGIRAADRDVAMVFQNYALYPHLTIAQNLAVPLLMRRLGARERLPFMGRFDRVVARKLEAIRSEAQSTANVLGIGHLMHRKPSQLSGGQRQRVALGRAIIRHPHVFLMDEPLSNLDAAMRVQMRTEIVALHRRVGACTVYVTHDQSEAMTMSDRVAVMMDGEILQFGSPEDIYTAPADLRVAAFVGSPRINVLSGRTDADGDVRVGGVRSGLRCPVPGAVSFAVRPEDLSVHRDGMAVIVEQVEYLGDSLLVHARMEQGDDRVVARLPVTDRSRGAPGQPASLRADPLKALLFGSDGRRIERAPATRLAANG
jgi:multiple sugar transport system ATP-binding protein